MSIAALNCCVQFEIENYQKVSSQCSDLTTGQGVEKQLSKVRVLVGVEGNHQEQLVS